MEMEIEKDNQSLCEMVGGLIIEYIDKELDCENAAFVSRHIESCRDCKRLYLDMKAVCDAAAQSAFEPPAELHSAVMVAVKADIAGCRRAKIKKMSAFTGIGVAAMLCISIGTAALLHHFDRPENDFDPFAENAAGINYEAFIFNKKSNAVLDASQQAADDVVNAADTLQLTEDFDIENGTGAETKSAEYDENEIMTECTMSGGFILSPGADEAADIACVNVIYGEWILSTESGSRILLGFGSASEFSIVDSYENITIGHYTFNTNTIVFEFSTGAAEYSYTYTNGALELTYLSGDILLR